MKHGFSLIEFLVYLGLTSIFSLVLFRGIGYSVTRLTSCASHAQQLVDLSLAYDSFARDIISAPHKRTAWKKISEHEVVWQGENEAVGWQWDGERLLRTTGMYDVREHVWRKATKSVAAISKIPCSFTVNGTPHTIANITMKTKLTTETPMTRLVVVRNGAGA